MPEVILFNKIEEVDRGGEKKAYNSEFLVSEGTQACPKVGGLKWGSILHQERNEDFSGKRYILLNSVNASRALARHSRFSQQAS